MESKSEAEFFELIKAQRERIVAHFYHEDFNKCKALNFTLEKVAHLHPETLFVKINAQQAPFLVQKLQIKTLPVLYYFFQGEVKDKIVGFEEIGTEEEVVQGMLVRRLGKRGAIDLGENEKFKLKTKNKVRGESEDEDED